MVITTYERNEQMNIIQVEVRNVYGVDRIYPLTHTQALKQLTGTLTLSNQHVEALKALGFEFEVKGPSL